MIASISHNYPTNFESVADRLPPENIDAEEAVLGGLLLDKTAIYRVWDTLKPEHFYVSAHKDIYQACISLAKKQQPTDLISINNWLSDHDLLQRIGGRNKTASLLDRSVSAINIDALANLLIEKSIRRQIIQLGNECVHFGYSTEIDLEEILSGIKERTTHVTELLSAKTEEDSEAWHYNRMIQMIRDIEMKCFDPGLKTWKMQNLAKKHGNGRSARDLESIYFKSLIAEENEPLMDLQELREKYGNQVKEWLLHGFLPKATTLLLHAKGGVGKTRLAYDLLYHLATGQDWSGFSVTADSRKALIIQTDESPSDMSAALEDRGFTDQMTVKYKTRWLVDHMQQLRRDVESHRPDIVLLDSLTSISRQSCFTENDTEYARPVLMLRDIAQEFGCTFIIIHHSNSGGESRGTKAIFNSVSEVWNLKRDDTNNTDGLERLLTIEKSRSRAPAKYRLRFEPEDKSWRCLGKEGEDPNSSSMTIRNSIVEFLMKNRGVRFANEEIAHEIGGSINTIRQTTFELSLEGIITRIKAKALGRGYSSLYTISRETANTRDHLNSPYWITSFPSTTDVSVESDLSDPSSTFLVDHLNSSVPTGVSDVTDPAPAKNNEKNSGENSSFLQDPDRLTPQPLQNIEKKVIQISDPPKPISDPVPVDHLSSNTSLQTQPKEPQAPAPCTCPRTGLPLPKPFTISVTSPLGVSTALVTPLKIRKKDNRTECRFEFQFANGTTSRKVGSIAKGKPEAEEIVTKEIKARIHEAIKHPSRRYKVQQLIGTIQNPEVRWVANCKCIEIPDAPHSDWWVFQAPDFEIIQVASEQEFELET
ncbi:putative replicative DNA helicase [Tolypothrix sp. NIES-4075]|uniref:AAA family ATPase n=1 Tax=Tolypothrix sp. NIES-4075 TaxID=2005459 RepID=UPI000B5CC7AF|nr:DnaB-like helicase N-terminal domain-containing protein [Tolypothrix sp. NIES-4075]GAX44695.1 putative replicative DNA helicase [Tolypothrix sp. NIES-4075]